MHTRQSKPRWRLAVVVALFVPCTYWALSAGCNTPPADSEPENPLNTNTNDNNNDNANTNVNDNVSPQLDIQSTACDQLDDEASDYEVKLDAESEDGRQLTYVRRLITDPAEGDSITIETEVRADGELVMRVTTTANADGAQVDVEYGPLVPGAQAAQAILQGDMITGEVDGRSLTPMNVDAMNMASPEFEDGAAAPATGMDPDLEQAVSQLLSAANDSGNGCDPQVMVDMQMRQSVFREIDTGHDSDPEASAACIGCWAGCSTGAVACVAGVSAGCAASLIFYAVCEAVGVASCAIAYAVCVGGCNATGAPCCPVACGEVACCASDETCLNSSIGICCSPGKTACVGEECCSSTQVCMDTGPNAGICCEPELICGNTCCEPEDTCLADNNLCCRPSQPACVNRCCPEGEICLSAGNCCTPELACGTSCCDELETCIPSQSLCCGFSQAPCGNTCCAIGESCVAGGCCPNERACGGICCPAGSGCGPGNVCEACPNPGEKYCLESDSCCPNDKVCSPVPGTCCEPGELYCSGACRPFAECIQ